MRILTSALVTFNPSTGQRLTTVLGPLGVSIPQIAINSRNELYVAVRDETTTTTGVRVFDTVTDRDLIPGPLNVGQLPPDWVLFLENRPYPCLVVGSHLGRITLDSWLAQARAQA